MIPGATRTLVATDLATPGLRDSWRRSRVGCHCPRAGEWITSTGYAFAEPATAAGFGTPDVIVLRVEPRDDSDAAPLQEDDTTIRRFLLAEPRGEIVLDVGKTHARVAIASSRWLDCAPPILLAISVCWRFAQLERRLDELTDGTRSQLESPSRRWTAERGRELDRRNRALQALVLDLPCFEGSLDDPSAYFASRDELRFYRRLIHRMRLADWRTRLGERIEILEGTVGSLVDERRHREQLSWEIWLETMILLALLVDIGFHLVMALLE